MMVIAVFLAMTLPDRQADLRTLNHLAQLYRSCHLPMPPASAPLTQVFSDSDSLQCAYVMPSPPDLNGKFPVWIGTGVVEGFQPQGGPIPTKLGATPIRSVAGIYRTFGQDADLALAIFEHVRGHDDLAIEILHWTQQNEFFEQDDMGDAVPPSELDARIYKLALSHWQNKLLERSRNLVMIHDRIQELFAWRPALVTDIRRDLLRQIEASMNPRYSGPSGDERRIDRLRDLTNPGRSETSSQDAAIIKAGFAMVPALIRHLHDPRLTLTVNTVVGNMARMNWTVGDACRAIICGWSGLSAERFSTENTDEKWINWWNSVQAIGERKYCEQVMAKPNPPLEIQMLVRSRYPKLLLSPASKN